MRRNEYITNATLGGSMNRFAPFALFAVLAAAAGCNSSNSVSTPPTTQPAHSIAHIVVMVQENRSFDNLFAGYPGANTTMQGQCKPAPWCKGSHVVPLHAVRLSTGPPNLGTDIDHSHHGFRIECDPNPAGVCQNDGFDLIHFGESGQAGPAKLYPYAYVDRSETKPYWNLAEQYTLSDETFFTETASSFIAHQMLLSGTVALNDHESETDQPVTTPWGCDSPPGDTTSVLFKDGRVSLNGPRPCFTWATLADLLDAKSVSWNFYVDHCCITLPSDFSGGVWNGYRAIRKVFYGQDWRTHISSPNTNILADVKAGKLPAVSWVIPSLYDSDHPASGCDGGPLWVTKVVNAVGTSRYWKDTAIILLWDDWGGWYDNAPPAQISYTSLGFRVPLIVISPFAIPHHVAHTHYTFGSILKLIERTFDLGTLGTTDATAASMANVFDLTQTPNIFKPAQLPRASACAHQVTNRAGMAQLIEHDGGPPE
jgi:phospholipase C